MAKKIELFDSNDQKCYPITREECVISSTGEILSEKLDSMEEHITRIDNTMFPVELIIFNPYSDKLLEKGVETDITISWVIKKQEEVLIPYSVKINGEALENPRVSEYTFEKIKDDLNITIEILVFGETITESTSIKFTSPIYIGFEESLEAIPMLVDNLNKFLVKDIYSEFFSVTNDTTGKYLWICIPKDKKINYFASEGFYVPTQKFEDIKDIEGIEYYCYRSSSNINSGNMLISIE